MAASDVRIRPADNELILKVRQHLEQCIQRDDSGALQLTVALPGEAALDTMAASLARMMALR